MVISDYITSFLSIKIVLNISMPSHTIFVLIHGLARPGGHNAVQLRILREPVYERQDHVPVKDEALARLGVRHIGKLLGRDVELLCKYLPVARRLVQHIHEIGVL